MILITGATGFIGRSLMARLAREGIEARGYNGRINDPLTLRQELDGVDTVIHLAGSEARGRKRLLNHVDVEGMERLIEECHRAEIKQIVFVSRIGADATSLHSLLKAKGQAERILKNSSIPFTILRSTTLFGHDDRFFEMIVGLAIWSWPFVWMPGRGTMSMQPLWVEDLVRCLVITLNNPNFMNKTVQVGGEDRLHYRLLVQQLLKATEYRRFLLSVPLVLLRPLSRLFFRWWYWPAVSNYFVNRFFIPDLADLDSVLRHFNFRPTRIKDAIAYLNRPGLRRRIFRK